MRDDRHSSAGAMPQETGILEFLRICDSLGTADMADAGVFEQRRRYEALSARFSRPLPPGLNTEDAPIGTVPTRSYRPARLRSACKLLYMHGGGFIVGSLDSHHAICADIAEAAGAELFAVDYRLAPEHVWPAQSDDAFTVLKLLLGDGEKVVVIGDGAGGNVAAGLTIRARDEELTGIAGQVLIYPMLGGDLVSGSYAEMALAPGLTTDDVVYWQAILKAPADEPVARPLIAASLAGLPPAFISAAHFDPLRDDGRLYAGRLAAAGGEVWFREEAQMVHGWLQARHVSTAAGAAFDRLCLATARFAGVPGS